eukprot:CAMPEP_0116985296 /NCGR_PEP_ID=MMETSP0467-20121206/62159_1 /TAXON_ID=283647 /ORGANISM="Mesodinium pulex, Strain SPMC105" /LENGTH=64 /DNA_ID=CAMNT_0004680563 /DNA_START=36 /DNA_END=227 /DNA_ORIENTATION=-
MIDAAWLDSNRLFSRPLSRLSFPSTASLVSETDSVHASAGGSTHASINDLEDTELGFSRTPSAS